MRELTFKVSAKTARLFGRENASNAEAAVSELVKNAYDADATRCVICLLPKYRSVPPGISRSEYDYVLERYPRAEELYGEGRDGTFHQRLIDTEKRECLDDAIAHLRELWIIDDGTGMSADIIERCWMVIGTNDKEQNVTSQKGRARTGAKGIGRFALDRLGADGTVYSTTEDEGKLGSIRWHVDWSRFDQEGSILDEIPAELEEDGMILADVLSPLEQLPSVGEALTGQRGKKWTTGTAIRIGLLRDDWSKDQVDQLFKTLGALIPPVRQRELSLYLVDESTGGAYGQVDPVLLEDFDYKLEASVAGEKVRFKIYRNELNPVEIDPGLFEREEMQQPPFDERSFRNGTVKYTKTLEEMFPGMEKGFARRVKEVGPFTTQLLYYKKAAASRRDAEIYPYRQFQAGTRKAWLEQFGGIKIYRDNFAVRPYGEVASRAFDWLALGQRVATSPVAASRRGWRVSPQNLAGTVSISRQANKRLCDQANREGIIENEHYSAFKDVILRVIEEFEADRSHIHHNLNELYQSKHEMEAVKSEGSETAERIVSRKQEATAVDAQQLAKAVVAQEAEIRELRDEQAMLRSLATLGTVLVSFSHEMGQLQNTMGSRSSSLANILSSYISPDEMFGVESPFNPYVILEEWEEDDKRVKQWFTFVLSTVRANRRRRRRRSMKEYLERAQDLWLGFLASREIELNIALEDEEANYDLLAFDIDLDSIFNNLILNSVEAFLSPRHSGPRLINIHVDSVDGALQITYWDSGPGLDPSIRDPNHIFRFGVTTKQGPQKDSGTGLGMWILSAVVHGYGGSCRVLRPRGKPGFRLRMTLNGLATEG